MSLNGSVPAAFLEGLRKAGYRPLDSPAPDPIELHPDAFNAVDDEGHRRKIWWAGAARGRAGPDSPNNHPTKRRSEMPKGQPSTVTLPEDLKFEVIAAG